MASRFAQSVCAPVVVFSLAVFFADLCGLESPLVSAEDARVVDSGDDDAGSKELTAEGAVAFVQSYCIDCHVGDDAESGLDLEGFASTADVASSIEAWNRIATRVH